MKKIFLSVFVAGVAFSMISCQKQLEEINRDPNNIPDDQAITPSALLGSSEGALAYSIGGDAARYTSVFMQYLEGTDRQFYSIGEEYSFNETDTDNFWRFNLYGGPLNDLYTLNKKSELSGNTNYAGVAKLLLAYSLMTASDMFGDIPYAEAFQGNTNLSPKYQTQAVIYDSIGDLIARARVQLADANSFNSPGTEDRIYGGDLGRWAMFADVLEARMHLHYAKKNGGTAGYQAALDAITNGKGFASNGDGAAFPFAASIPASSPWYQFANDRAGYIGYGGYMATWLDSLADPRGDVYGQIQDGDGLVATGNIYGGVDALLPLLTYAEQKFIEAECRFRIEGASQAAHDAYIAGINASLDYCRVTADAAFFAQTMVDPGVANLTLEHIMFQKHVAMFSQPEAWVDYRRTGFPAITPKAGASVPRRFPYAESERLYNANTPSGLTIYDRVDWDVQ